MAEGGPVAKARIAIIAAVARNGVIGDAGGLPWRLSTDMKRFRELTLGKPVIMGRKTFDTIGGPLKGRTNIVVSRNSALAPAGVTVVPTLEKALATARGVAADAEIMVIGGGELYAASLGLADRLYITHVEATPPGDTHFPAIDPGTWQVVSSETVPAGERDSVRTTFVIYERAGRRSG